MPFNPFASSRCNPKTSLSRDAEVNDKPYLPLKKPSLWSKLSKKFKDGHTQRELRERRERCDAHRRTSRLCKSMGDLGDFQDNGDASPLRTSQFEQLPSSGSISKPLVSSPSFSRTNPSTQLATDRWCQISCRLDLEGLSDSSFDDLFTSFALSVEDLAEDGSNFSDKLCDSSVATGSNTTTNSISTTAPSPAGFYSALHKNVSSCTLAVSPTPTPSSPLISEDKLQVSGPSEPIHRVSRYAWVATALQSFNPAKKATSCDDLSSTLLQTPGPSHFSCPSRLRRSASASDLRVSRSVLYHSPPQDVERTLSPSSMMSMTPPSLSHILDLDRELGNVWGLTQEDVTLGESDIPSAGALPDHAESSCSPPTPSLRSNLCHMPYAPGCRLSTISEASETMTVASGYHGRYRPLDQQKHSQNATLRHFSVPPRTPYTL